MRLTIELPDNLDAAYQKRASPRTLFSLYPSHSNFVRNTRTTSETMGSDTSIRIRPSMPLVRTRDGGRTYKCADIDDGIGGNADHLPLLFHG